MTKTAAVEQAPEVANIQDYRERRVTLEEARLLQQEGKLVPNKKYGQHNEPSHVFRCSHIIHWRPNTALPELNQYATVRPA